MKFLDKGLATKLGVLAVSSSLLTGCIDDILNEKATESDHYAVVATQASDYTTGDISIISLTDYSADNSNFAGGSDAVVSTHDENFYRLGRYSQDNITKFSIHDPETKIWGERSVNGEGEENSNPYKLVVKDDTTAYLIRFGQPTVWIVDPSTTDDAKFKTGEIDLGDYAAVDDVPDVSDALIIDDKIYFLIQNLDSVSSDTWIPGQAYIAVFDTADNSEVATNSDSGTPKGIALKTKNPNKMVYDSSSNNVYIASIGKYASSYYNTPAEFTGGIESVKLSSYETSLVVDDGDDDAHPYGNITNIAVLNSTRGYFVGYASYGHTNVYSFNPQSSEVDATPILADKDVIDIEIGPLGNLWVANRTDAGITIFDTVDNTVFKEIIDTDLLPVNIEFISVEHSH